MNIFPCNYDLAPAWISVAWKYIQFLQYKNHTFCYQDASDKMLEIYDIFYIVLLWFFFVEKDGKIQNNCIWKILILHYNQFFILWWKFLYHRLNYLLSFFYKKHLAKREKYFIILSHCFYLDKNILLCIFLEYYYLKYLCRIQLFSTINSVIK